MCCNKSEGAAGKGQKCYLTWSDTIQFLYLINDSFQIIFIPDQYSTLPLAGVQFSEWTIKIKSF